MEDDSKKAHRKRQAGPKAEKRAKGKSNPDKKNSKAFGFQSVKKAARTFHRKQDLETKKQHVPVVDRTPLEPPPIVVGIVGPPKVGKTTLIRSLIKNFTREKFSDIRGPVTLVSGKRYFSLVLTIKFLLIPTYYTFFILSMVERGSRGHDPRPLRRGPTLGMHW